MKSKIKDHTFGQYENSKTITNRASGNKNKFDFLDENYKKLNLKKNISLEQSQTLVRRIDELRTRDDRIQMRREDSLKKNEITKLPSIDQDSKSGLKCKNYIYVKIK